MKNQTIGNCYRSNKADRWMLFALNLLGDPEMPVFLNQPQKFENVSLTSTNTSVTIDTGVDGCQICCMSTTDIGEDYYEVWDSVRCTTFSNIPNDVTICITKAGYIPYITSFNKIKYIQNETINDNIFIFANRTYIGSDVTTEKEQGSVCIESGKTIIQSSYNVTIRNSFEIKKGTIYLLTLKSSYR